MSKLITLGIIVYLFLSAGCSGTSTIITTPSPQQATTTGTATATRGATIPVVTPAVAPAGSIPADLVGTWVYISSSGGISYTFNQNGTFSRNVVITLSGSCTTTTSAINGRVTLDGSTMTLQDTAGTIEIENTCQSTKRRTEPQLKSETLNWSIEKGQAGTLLQLGDFTYLKE